MQSSLVFSGVYCVFEFGLVSASGHLLLSLKANLTLYT